MNFLRSDTGWSGPTYWAWLLSLDTWQEKVQIWVAFHLPKWLVMWCVIRVFAAAQGGRHGNDNGNDNVVDMDYSTALSRFQEEA